MSSLTPNARAELIKQHLKSGGAIKGTRTYPHPFTYTLLDHGGATVDTFDESQMVPLVQARLVVFRPVERSNWDHLVGQLAP